MGQKFKLSLSWQAVLGLVLVLGYWLLVRPPTWGRLGYSDDMAGLEISRQIMADNLREGGLPSFFTHRMMAPAGTSAAFFSWAIERDWLGAYFWMWNREFPYLYLYLGASFVLSYLCVGYIVRKMGLSKLAGWGLAAAVVIFHVPRHFKLYPHFEHVIHHWPYIALFLDAWIWQCVWRERRWRLDLEAWRGLVLLLTFGISGYFWGPFLLEWFLVRGSILCVRGKTIELHLKRLVLPVVLGCLVSVIDLLWFLPLLKEMSKLGELWQGNGWIANPLLILRPVWLDLVAGWFGLTDWVAHARMAPITNTETVIVPGWLWLVPALSSLWFTRRKSGGPGVAVVLPFFLFLLFIVLYIRGWIFGTPIQQYFPFLKFYRVAVRMGLYLPELLGAIIALSWPELSRAWLSKRARPWLAVFVVSCLLELPILVTTHAEVLAPMDPSLDRILTRVRESEGTTVLDMPFCVHGGNLNCPYCSGYPEEVVPLGFTGTHDKKVYGIYLARLVASQCEVYGHQPYQSWFSAWRSQRCLTPAEWDDFCKYLDEHRELAAVLVYPDIWLAAGDPSCQAQMEQRLGAKIDEGRFVIKTTRDLDDLRYSRIFQYAPRCSRAR